MYAATACPGPDLLKLMDRIVDEANAINSIDSTLDPDLIDEVIKQFKMDFKEEAISAFRLTNIGIDSPIYEFSESKFTQSGNISLLTKYSLSSSFTMLDSMLTSIQIGFTNDGNGGVTITDDIFGVRGVLEQVNIDGVSDMLKASESLVKAFPGGEFSVGYAATGLTATIEAVYNVNLIPHNNDIDAKVSFKVECTISQNPSFPQFSFSPVLVEGSDLVPLIAFILILCGFALNASGLVLAGIITAVPGLDYVIKS